MENFEVEVPQVESVPVWKNPDSELFVEWYLEHSGRSEEEQSQEFRDFLAKVEVGEVQLPTDEAIARHTIEGLRHRKNTEW